MSLGLPDFLDGIRDAFKKGQRVTVVPSNGAAIIGSVYDIKKHVVVIANENGRITVALAHVVWVGDAP